MWFLKGLTGLRCRGYPQQLNYLHPCPHTEVQCGQPLQWFPSLVYQPHLPYSLLDFPQSDSMRNLPHEQVFGLQVVVLWLIYSSALSPFTFSFSYSFLLFFMSLKILILTGSLSSSYFFMGSGIILNSNLPAIFTHTVLFSFLNLNFPAISRPFSPFLYTEILPILFVLSLSTPHSYRLFLHVQKEKSVIIMVKYLKT